jgi:hypothetical protein
MLTFAHLVFLLNTVGLLHSAIAPGNIDFDFKTAREIIERQKNNINYNQSFCMQTGSGADKIVCRLKEVPSIGFLICKKILYKEEEEEEEEEGKSCEDVIKDEMNSLKKLNNQGIKIVAIGNEPIKNVKCGETDERTCTGFLEAWIDATVGQFGHVRDHIANNTVAELIGKVLQFTSKGGLQTTINDLRKIVTFMQPSPDDSYKQICDLQGFFLKNGGFLINDTPNINENISKDGSCWPDEPTTADVLANLTLLIGGLEERQTILR